jgi:SAM-dependent methyltransferase
MHRDDPVDRLQEREGRHAFGADPLSYDRGRPDYPGWMFDALSSVGALYRNAATLEIGAGSGIASRRLLAAGAAPLTLLEPDSRFGAQLEALAESAPTVEIRHEPFEEAALTPGSFDLILAATAFHWLDPAVRVARMAELLRHGGHVALIWNVFQIPGLPDPFHEATRLLLAELADSPSGSPDAVPFALDRASREQEFLEHDRFELRLYAEGRWSLLLDPEEVGRLYSGFAGVARLPEARRAGLLLSLRRIAREQFDGTVVRNMTSPLYLFRKRG